MSEKKLVLILNTSQEYIRHVGPEGKKFAPLMNRFFESITDVYLPLVKMFEALERDGVPFKVGLVMTPSLCTLLEDSSVQSEYLEWLDGRIELGKSELVRCAADQKLLSAAKFCLEKHQEAKLAFENLGRRILRKIHEFSKKGFIELIATCGTDIFLPHYHDMEEIKNAQIEAGLFSFKSFFGQAAEGFWLPELGYYPGLERNLRNYNVNYTVLDARSFLFGEEMPVKGIFAPVRIGNSVVAFGRNPNTDEELFGFEGYANNDVYLDKGRDVGYELSDEKVENLFGESKSRYSLGYCYWNKGGRVSDADYVNVDSNEHVYEFEAAVAKCEEDALSFVNKRIQLMNDAGLELSDTKTISLTETININSLNDVWSEGIFWLECVFRAAHKQSLEFANAKDLILEQFKFQKIHPYYGSCSDDGYGEALISHKNNWMIRYVRKASERMVDLSERFCGDTGLKARLLNLGAKELLIAQSSGWARMIENDSFPEYAKHRFIQTINDFTAVFDALGSNTVSTEWLTNLEESHKIFPWMNYRIFSRKS